MSLTLERHIFGMAKSALDLRGAKSRNLELDFVNLFNAVEAYRAAGHQAYGYLAILTGEIRQRVLHWSNKHRTGDCIRVFVVPITDAERSDLEKEKERNRWGSRSRSDPALAIANLGRDLVEHALKLKCFADHPGITERAESPRGIKWDFYGVVQVDAASEVE